MKKKLMALFCVVLMVVSTSITAFALPSAEGGRFEAYDPTGVLKILKKQWDELTDSLKCDHEDCEGTLELVTPATEKFREIIDSLDFKKLIEGTKYASKEWMKVFEMELIAKDCVEFPVTIEYDMADWAEGKPLSAHYDDASESWELIEWEEKDGKYVTTLNSFSPVVFYLEKDAAAGTESPKTGEPITLAVAAVAAGATGLVLVSRKKKED